MERGDSSRSHNKRERVKGFLKKAPENTSGLSVTHHQLQLAVRETNCARLRERREV